MKTAGNCCNVDAHILSGTFLVFSSWYSFCSFEIILVKCMEKSLYTGNCHKCQLLA